ncbi:MAG: ribbon-helix-helix protein, CopG family [Acidobacteriaceae bacterium]|nr:ribbon-helix-helix protein, CopG family [Acidobacteriaceae bacterium]
MSTAPPTPEFTISLPEDLAQKVDQLAQQESRNTNELFREAFRTYFARQLRARMKQTQRLAAASKPKYKKSETRRLLREIRQETKTATS